MCTCIACLKRSPEPREPGKGKREREAFVRGASEEEGETALRNLRALHNQRAGRETMRERGLRKRGLGERERESPR